MEVLPNISVHRNENDTTLRVSYRILSWGGETGDSRMIVACERTLMHAKFACLLGGSRGIPPLENFKFRSSQIASDPIWEDCCLIPVTITILNFKISGGEGGEIPVPPPHLYKALCSSLSKHLLKLWT